jgi:hypothetical protein
MDGKIFAQIRPDSLQATLYGQPKDQRHFCREGRKERKEKLFKFQIVGRVSDSVTRQLTNHGEQKTQKQ